MFWVNTAVCLLALCVGILASEEYNYYDYYYDEPDTTTKTPEVPGISPINKLSTNAGEDIYEEKGENTDVYAGSPIKSVEFTESGMVMNNPMKHSEFRARILCTEKIMALEVDKTLLPAGLGFLEESIPEDILTEDFNSSATCRRLSHNETHFIYKVALRCHRAVGELKFGSMTVYAHEVLLTNVDQKGIERNREVYTVLMECETELPIGRGDAERRDFTPEYRLYEHRGEKACSSVVCPHGDMCLPNKNINGYFCQCSEHTCECPVDFYGCSQRGNTTLTLMCIRNDQLCDKRFDCPLQDDEQCTDVWTQWSVWTSCSETCGEGRQLRQRSCVHTFTKDPARCSKRCMLDQGGKEIDERSCASGSCASVQCMGEEMLIAIPLEYGMTKESVGSRMHIRGSSDCKPMANSTHAKFMVPLHKCNTKTWVDGEMVFYSVEIVYEIETEPSTVILREFGHSYTAKCQYNRRQTVGLRRFEMNPGTELVDVAALKFKSDFVNGKGKEESMDLIEHFASGDGEFEYNMDIFEDVTFASPYSREDYPLQKKLGERMYIGVNFNSQDEDLHVFIQKCWATASDENGISDEDKTYTIIDNGCRVDSTVIFHTSELSSFSDRFSLEAFKFNDPDHWFVYFRCDVILCDVEEDDPACRRECGKEINGSSSNLQPREKRALSTHQNKHGHVMQGPVIILDEDYFAIPITSERQMFGRSVGSVQHKLIKYGDANDEKKIPFSGDQNQQHQFWGSPITSAILVGIVCLVVGGILGFAVRRRMNYQQSNEKPPKDEKTNILSKPDQDLASSTEYEPVNV